MSLALYEVPARRSRRQRRYELEIDRLMMAQKHNEAMKGLYADMSAFRRNMKHQMQLIAQMASGEDTQMQDYIMNLTQTVQALYPFATGNQAVDALLTVKNSMMRHKQIELNLRPYPLNELPMQEVNFCVVLGNVLDNAMEGINRIKEDTLPRTVTLSFSRSWDMFYIICKNPYDIKTVRWANGRLMTSKA
ncbi:MAG: GHKL domain-containing protein, partial [Clostridia bacterium]